MTMLAPDRLWPMVAFALAVSYTPGPNNLIAIASAATFGMRATLPFVTGVAVGLPIMLLAVAAGLGGLLEALPAVAILLKAAGTLYLLWLAVKIGRSVDLGLGAAGPRGRPVGFLQSCLLQWLNPKAWIIAVGGLGTFATPGSLWQVAAALMALSCIAAWSGTALWAAFGAGAARLLGSRARVRLFNLAMALLLVLSLWPTLRELLAGIAARAG
jgi:threonine/homoserine/homoserine lactone efflux protein